MRSVLLVGVLVLGLYAQTASAAGPYADVSLARYKVEVSSGTARPYVARVKVGYEVTKTVAAELVYGEPLENDTLADESFDVESVIGYYLRYQSQYHNNVRMFLFAGKTEIETTQIGDSAYQFDDTTWGIGAEEQMRGRPNMHWVLEYAQFFNAGGDRITGITFGVRWDI